MKVHGACHCGQLKFEADIDPDQVRICHCTDCQTMSASAYRVNVRVDAANFRLASGEPRIYVRVAASGNRRAHGFCANCGTQIYSAAERNPPNYSVRVGTLEERDQLPARSQIWFDSALPWAQDIRALSKVGRQ